MWDPKALKRIHYPIKDTVGEKLKAEQEGEYYRREFERSEDALTPEQRAAKEEALKKKSAPYQHDFNSQRTFEECYKLDYPEESAEDLKLTIAEETNSIIVTVWYQNAQSKWGQNLINQDVQGTLWKIICKNHPRVIYTEADVSNYNRFAYSYRSYADEIHINLDGLLYGPIVTVLYDQSGYAFVSDDGPRKLINQVDDFIHELEQKNFEETNEPCDLKHEVLADNHFEHFLPDETLKMYDPQKDELGKDARAEKKVAVHAKTRPKLSEPEKSFN